MCTKTQEDPSSKISREKRGTVSREVPRKRSVLGREGRGEGGMDEEGQKNIVAYCHDRDTESRDQLFCFAYGGQIGVHDYFFMS